jgi:ubiquinone/menaquinone biosynthesis C-methylase UbiE
MHPMTKPWMIEERDYAGAEHLNDAFVAAYDRKQQFDPSADVAALADHGLGRDSTLVDLGAGTGTFALAAAATIGRVVAVDVSVSMVHMIGQRAEALSVPNVERVEAGLLSYEHAGPAPDAMYTRNVLHQLPDFWKGVALDRIAQLLPSGGLLFVRDLVYDFHPSEAEVVLEAWFAGAPEDPSQGYTRRDLEEHVRTENSTYRWLFESILETAGFEILDVQFQRSVYGAYTCRKP